MTDRIPRVTDRDRLAPAARDHHDHVVETRGELLELYAVLLNSPEAAGRVARLGTYLRYESSLPARVREVAILTAARAFDCAYEWAVHEPLAREAGVSEATLDALAETGPVDALADDLAPVVEYARRLFDDHEVPPAVYEAVHERFGDAGTVDLTVTVGYYAMLACVLNAFAVTPAAPGECW